METQDTDIGNVYIEAKTLEKVYIITGTAFGDREDLEFHIGCHLLHNSNGVLLFPPNTYIDKMAHTYMNMFGLNTKLNKAIIYPLEQRDQPELVKQ